MGSSSTTPHASGDAYHVSVGTGLSASTETVKVDSDIVRSVIEEGLYQGILIFARDAINALRAI